MVAGGHPASVNELMLTPIAQLVVHDGLLEDQGVGESLIDFTFEELEVSGTLRARIVNLTLEANNARGCKCSRHLS
jgi:hypothetical protein